MNLNLDPRITIDAKKALHSSQRSLPLTHANTAMEMLKVART